MKNKQIKKESMNKSVFQNITKWEVDRRKFVKTISVSALMTQIMSFESCMSSNKQVYLSNQFLTAKQAETIQKVQNILFPNNGFGPSILDINAYPYFLWVLADERKNSESKKYLVDGIDWTNETANETYGKSFVDLSEKETKQLVKIISETSWGKNWLSMLLTLIFEALSLDPIYGANTNEIGWQWLDQFVGTPRPKESNKYDNIFKTIHGK